MSVRTISKSAMKLNQILSPSFREMREALYQKSFTLYHPASMVQKSLSVDSQFCRALVNCGYLSFGQMLHAACRYRLGASRSGRVIFWQIDNEGIPHDGKIVCYEPNCHRSKKDDEKPTWVKTLLRYRNHEPKSDLELPHCLFGLHLLRESGGEVAIVEAEKTAVIMSEHFPQYIWLASGGLTELQDFKFRPLRGRKVVLFPDTDTDGTAFRTWHRIAQEVMTSPFWEGSPPIRVSGILEQKATPAQKEAKIDLIDFLF
jgi:hypothetical protein